MRQNVYILDFDLLRIEDDFLSRAGNLRINLHGAVVGPGTTKLQVIQRDVIVKGFGPRSWSDGCSGNVKCR